MKMSQYAVFIVLCLILRLRFEGSERKNIRTGSGLLLDFIPRAEYVLSTVVQMDSVVRLELTLFIDRKKIRH